LHAASTNVNRVVAGQSEELSEAWRQGVIDESLHADRGTGTSRSVTDAAAKRRHSRMSSV
jgi:hypothetical protein